MNICTGNERYHPFFPKHSWNLPAMLFNAGCEERRHDRPYEFNGLQRGNRDLAIFQYTLDGEGELEFEGTRYRVLPGTAMLLTIPENHCYRLPDHSEYWKYYYISVEGREAMHLFREFRRRHHFLMDFPMDSPVIRRIETLLAALRNHEIADRPTASRFAYDFIMTLLSSGLDSAGVRSNGLLPLVDQFCLDHMAQPVTVADLARKAGLSFWHFSRKFKKETGESPHDYLMKLKLEYALRLLQNTGEPIKAISYECGFLDQSHFCKVFRRFYGETPENFRHGIVPLQTP